MVNQTTHADIAFSFDAAWPISTVTPLPARYGFNLTRQARRTRRSLPRPAPGGCLGVTDVIARATTQPIVRDYCLEHGITYTETGLIESYRIALRHLDEAGTHTLP
jgi:hypothetical protein